MKLPSVELSRQLRKDTALLEFIDRVSRVINFGRYQMRIVTTVPTHVGDDGEHLLYISGKIKRLYFYDPTNSAWNYLVPMVATVSLTGQTGDIGATTLFTPSATGTYRVSVYLVCTTAGTGTLVLTIGWTDDEQAQTVKPAVDIDLANLGEASSGVSFIQSAAAVAITYTAAIAGKAGSPAYSLYITLEQLS